MDSKKLVVEYNKCLRAHISRKEIIQNILYKKMIEEVDCEIAQRHAISPDDVSLIIERFSDIWEDFVEEIDSHYASDIPVFVDILEDKRPEFFRSYLFFTYFIK